MKLVHGVIALAAILSAVPSFAQAEATTPAAAATDEVTAPVAAPATAMSAKPQVKQRMICRREVDIGSLVRGTRRCATVQDWQKSSDAARDTTMRMQDQKGFMAGH